MSDLTVLAAERRTDTGKGAAGRCRRSGRVPAVVYGLDADPVPVSVAARELGHILSGEAGANTLITLEVDGTSQLTLARQIQRDPVKGTLVHVDFIRIRADRPVHAEIPLHLVGEPAGVDLGGVLDQMLHTLNVEAKPADLPPSFEHDVSALGLGEHLNVRDIPAPAGVTILNEPEELVAMVAVLRGLGAEAEAEAAAEGEGEAAAASAAAAEGEASEE